MAGRQKVNHKQRTMPSIVICEESGWCGCEGASSSAVGVICQNWQVQSGSQGWCGW